MALFHAQAASGIMQLPTALTSDVSACSALGARSARPFYPPAAAAGVPGRGY